MDFGKNILQKYGWKEGEGIGKNADGIAKPIKASLKFDNAGLGHDRGKEFTNHWWQNAFNNAAKNIDVNTRGGEISMSLKNGESVEITTKEYSVRNLKKKQGEQSSGYGSFVMGSVMLDKGGCDKKVADRDSDSDDDLPTKNASFSTVMSDEALFAACGGRTAHKGARHGLSLSGKLSRIEEQEKQLLEKYSSSFNSETATEVFKEWSQVDSKKKKKNSKGVEIPPTPNVEGINDALDPLKLCGLVNQSDYTQRKKSKKSRKRERDAINQISTLTSSMATSLTAPPQIEAPVDKGDWRGVQSTSKTIRKEKKSKNADQPEKTKEKKKKHREHTNVDTSEPGTSSASQFLKDVGLSACKPQPDPAKQRTIDIITTSKSGKKSKKRKRGELELSDDSDNDFDLSSTLVTRIRDKMKAEPNKHFQMKHLTKLQIKHLAKSGFKITKRKTSSTLAKEKEENVLFDRISKKMRTSLSLDEDEEP